MKVNVSEHFEDRNVISKLKVLCFQNGFEIVEAPVDADVWIVQSRYQVFDALNMGKSVIQFIWNDSIQSAEELAYFERFKDRIFVCRNDGAPYGGTGSVLFALYQIQGASNAKN